MSEELQSQFDEFERTGIIRRKLLPWWIKTFCWIFMFLSLCGLGTLIGSAFSNNVQLSLYGFETNTAYSIIGIFLIAVMTLKGYAGYSLWFEKANAILIAKIDAIVGIVICVVSMLIPLFTDIDANFSFRIELLLLIPYFIKIYKIENEWNNA